MSSQQTASRMPTRPKPGVKSEHRRGISVANVRELRELGEAIARLESSEPGSEVWANALEATEDAVYGLNKLEKRQSLLDKLTVIKSRLESTQPATDERRHAIREAYEVIEALEDADDEEED